MIDIVIGALIIAAVAGGLGVLVRAVILGWRRMRGKRRRRGSSGEAGASDLDPAGFRKF